MTVLDLGGGDGRVAKSFAQEKLGRYVVVDVAQELLDRAPAWVEKMKLDLNQSWELDQRFDLLLCFFVLLHLHDIEHFFTQAALYVQPGGRLIVLHHLERKPFLHTVNHEKFKIQIVHHSFEELELQAERYGFSCDYLDLENHGAHDSRVYCFTMSE
ncbi:MAG: class I SAM-dependent methyltransferase [Candidatus Peribacteria bacterium]|nr:MAG: class I SAM-dependent methyltransferase [Candidatus Peribacteria bacterium]